MDAIQFLKQQHDQVEELFDDFENNDEEKLSLFEQIADALAIHAAIEERWFYPAVRYRQTERHLEEAYDDHLEIKRLLADCMVSTGEPGFDGRLAALMAAVLEHFEAEENVLFPEIERIFDEDGLEALGQQLEAAADVLEEQGNARLSIMPEMEPPPVQP
jgi:hemerythrin superfamily protein